MTKYASERYNPSLAMCQAITLSFNGTVLTMRHGKRAYIYQARAGQPDSSGFRYGWAIQRVEDVGPIPEGTYWINPNEMAPLWWKPWLSSSSWGSHRITIHPFTLTEMHGRGGFFIHGGSAFGSGGCIDLTGRMEEFVRNLKREVGSNNNCQIHLTVNYPGGWTP